jgi:hypothetical protein
MRSSGLYFHVFTLALLGGCTFQASCGGKKLDVDKGEKLIAAKLKEASGLDATVTCPDNVKLAKDVAMECDVKINNLPGKAKVVQTDDQGNVNWTLIEGYVFTARAEELLQTHFGKEIRQEVKADCGSERVRLSEPGKAFRCKLSAADGGAAVAEVKIKDKEGNVDLSLVTE